MIDLFGELYHHFGPPLGGEWDHFQLEFSKTVVFSKTTYVTG